MSNDNDYLPKTPNETGQRNEPPGFTPNKVEEYPAQDTPDEFRPPQENEVGTDPVKPKP